ncbi:MAG: PAS domain S-box protein, partial [Planctomycetota bacterium]
MLVTCIPAAAFAAAEFERWWLLAALVAVVLVLVAYANGCHRIVQQPLRIAQAEVRAARDRFQWLAENVAEVVMQTNDKGIVQWITPSATARFGRPPQELIGKPFMNFVHPDDWDRVEAMNEQLQMGTAFETDVRLRIGDDGYRWFSLVMRPMFDARGTVSGRVGGWRDIQHEVQAREAVEAERRRLQATLEGLLNPHVFGRPVRDESGQVVDFVYADANPAACSAIGIDRDQFVGRRMLELHPAVETTGLLKMFAHTMDTGRPTAVDAFPFPYAAGVVRWIDIRAMRVDERVGFTWRDVTEQHESAKKLAASEEQFRLLAENSSDVVMRVGKEGQMLWVSPSVTAMLGWPADELIGRQAGELCDSDEERLRFVRELEQVLAGRSIMVRTKMRAKEGILHWVEVHAGPYRNAAGRIDGIVASLCIVDADVEAERILDRRARTDELTALLNRKELLERIATRDARTGQGIAVLWCDIDRFKSINDTYGHAAGDAVLQALADRIRGCLRTTDDLGARIGGDELMVVLHGVRDLQDALNVAEKLRCQATEPVPTPAGPITTTLSIGVTLAQPDESTDT